MKTRLLLVVLAIGLVAILFLVVNRRPTEPTSSRPIPGATTKESSTDEPLAVGTAAVSVGSSASPVLATAAPATTSEILGEMDTVKFYLRDYRAALGGNPVGNNAEITKALLGTNPSKTKFVLSGDARLNANGELVDHWGTPYFFHQLSAREMEIRSAGPDKRMWTSDDLVVR